VSSRRFRAELGSIEVTTPVLVLRRSLGELQHGVLAVARSLGRLGIPVYAVQMSAHEPATRSRYIRQGLLTGVDLPLSDAFDQEWLTALMDLPAELGRPLLVPIDDVSAVFVGDHQERLRERFVLPDQPSGIQRRLASKRELSDLCRRLDIPCPASTFPANEQQALGQAAVHGYPIVLKRSDPWLPPRDLAAPSVLIARSEAELVNAYARMESDVSPQVMLQDYIPGGSDSIWMFNGYFNRDSECVCGFTGRKLRQRGPHTGPTTLGVCVSNDTVRSAAIRLMRELGYRGIVDMGFRYDQRDGSYRLLDVNPRLGSSFRLFVGEDGIDVVRAAYLELTGQPVSCSDVPNGRTWIVEPYDVVASAQLAREGSLTLREWLRSMRGVDEAAWWASDDPNPFASMCGSLLWQGPRYVIRHRAQGKAPAQTRGRQHADPVRRRAA
jgi:predicted ATP-grasp superfamily ATP-dependent carboligase